MAKKWTEQALAVDAWLDKNEGEIKFASQELRRELIEELLSMLIKKGRTLKVDRKEFKGNVKVTVSEREVRLWVCNEKGANVFRFKAIGEVHSQSDGVVVIGGDW